MTTTSTSRAATGSATRAATRSVGRATTGTADLMHPACLPAAAHSYLDASANSLREAITATEVPTRYACAHVAALRAAAALLAVRAVPAAARGRKVQRNAWVLLTQVAPEVEEWANFFAAGASKRAAAEAGSTRAVTEREADDLVREADRFLGVIEQLLGLHPHVPVEQQMPWRGGARSSA